MNPPATPPEALSALPRWRAFIGMGGNLGEVQAHFRSALRALDALVGTRVEAVSPLYRTRPVASSGPDYLNAVAVLQCALGPHELLGALQRLEWAHDRERPYQNAPRTLDLDMLWYGGLACASRTLTLPHPRMTQRAFVLAPLMDVLGVIGLPASTLALPDEAARARLAEAQGIECLGPLDWAN